ncbi:hypothetical protein [Jiella avicenniae]|uniref:Uncharacterized protein n=1 Tax=Jiella avicenniae TaxID=2907202 RepID=A0A9X1T7D2_9HYPH|nr:hypothetical protein [Jiella avicenniae]MCE7030280.1 hypothetical protein [Jiella avicenniae]
MKTTAIFSAALLGASIFSYGALAQSQTIVPGSESQLEDQNAQERDAVGQNSGMTGATVAQPESETMVPGSESQREDMRAEERDSVAAGEDAMATGAVGTDAPANGQVIVPGSEADTTSTMEPTTQSDRALEQTPGSQTQ